MEVGISWTPEVNRAINERAVRAIEGDDHVVHCGYSGQDVEPLHHPGRELTMTPMEISSGFSSVPVPVTVP